MCCGDATLLDSHKAERSTLRGFIMKYPVIITNQGETIAVAYDQSGIELAVQEHYDDNTLQLFTAQGGVASFNTGLVCDLEEVVVYPLKRKSHNTDDEPERVGHPHSELMMQYAEDAAMTDKPWELYQIKTVQNIWKDIGSQFIFDSNCTYRRKPKTHTVHGVEIPDLRVSPELGEKYYLADPLSSELAELHSFVMRREKLWNERGLTYQYTEEGKQAAIRHSKAMLGIK